MASRQLPKEIESEQICSECLKFLSVSPIWVSRNGKSVCGRCISKSKPHEKYTESIFNVLAQGYRFKCSNYLNGCDEVLDFSETADHEQTCVATSQSCIFCSFSGNWFQIWNHCSKNHAHQISSDGVVTLFIQDLLKDYYRQKLLLFEPSNNNLILVIIESTDCKFRLMFEVLTNHTLKKLSHYSVKFLSGYDESHIQIDSDYGLLRSSFAYEKPKRDVLAMFEAPATTLRCQISLCAFNIEELQMEIEQKLLIVQKDQRLIHDMRIETEKMRAVLTENTKTYICAMQIIKQMSLCFFRCSKCKRTDFKDTHFCPKIHCYCKNCLSSFCQECGTIREFSRLTNLENFIVACDWPNCKLEVRLVDAPVHKCICLHRPYKCPLKFCNEVIFSSANLVKHWHSNVPALVQDNEIVCDRYQVMEYYWLLETDLYHVIVHFLHADIKVTIEEFNVTGNSKLFKCQGLVERWRDFTFEEFLGKYQLTAQNMCTLTALGNFSTQSRYSKLRLQHAPKYPV
ncbi:uncharacterized protein [Euwallacea fornicatus]|uniref:uncharacterized protein n=1 Tax=Euwallacea fornicatus TaxID=995702 RepID=UPI00338ECB04